jgi:hypothetical protein
MTFTEAIADLKITVDRPDIEAGFLDFLNRGVHETAARHDWDQLKVTSEITIATGQRSAALPSTFKSWQNGRFCADNKIGSAAAVPVPVYTRSDLESLSTLFRPTMYIVYTQDNGGFQISIPNLAAAANVITAHYFAFPAAATDPNTTTPLLRDFPNMVLSKTRSLIFQSINDPVYTVHEEQFEKEVAIARDDDIKSSNPKPDPDKE